MYGLALTHHHTTKSRCLINVVNFLGVFFFIYCSISLIQLVTPNNMVCSCGRSCWTKRSLLIYRLGSKDISMGYLYFFCNIRLLSNIINADISPMMLSSSSCSCIVPPKGRIYHQNACVLGYLVAYAAKVLNHALLMDSNNSSVTGMCFFLLVVPADAENLFIFPGRIMSGSLFARSIHSLY